MNIRALMLAAGCVLALSGLATPAVAEDLDARSALLEEVPVRADTAPVVLERTGLGLCCPVPDACPCPRSCIKSPLLRVPCIDDCWDKFQKSKEENCFKLGAGAYHWFHYNNAAGATGDRLTYGYPGLLGTYFYYVNGDIECDTCGCVKIGAHAQVRFRDASAFRTFFGNDRVWLYEGYGYLKAPGFGMVKFGKIWSRFGLDWDDSFWGNVAYYNGYKLNPEWGLSWEHSKEWTRLSLPWFAQVFFGEDGVNGSITGGDSESSAIVDTEVTGIVRAVPTYHVNKNTDIALGLSALVGSLSSTDNSASSRYAFAADLTVTWCDLKVYAEYIFADGDGVHEAHYATGGQTTKKTIWQVGGAYTYGPFTGRATYSRGEYSGPGGNEDILLFGLDVKATNWLTVTFEYQDWNVNSNAAPASVKFEDGFSLVLHWNV